MRKFDPTLCVSVLLPVTKDDLVALINAERDKRQDEIRSKRGQNSNATD